MSRSMCWLFRSQMTAFVTTKDGRLLMLTQDGDDANITLSNEIQFSAERTKYQSVMISDSIWIAGNNTIVIIDHVKYVETHRIDRVFPFGHGVVECMVTDQKHVWCSSEWSVSEISVESRAITRLFEIRGDCINGISAVNLVPFSSSIDGAGDNETETEVVQDCVETDSVCDSGLASKTDSEVDALSIVPRVPPRNKHKQTETIYCNVNTIKSLDVSDTESRSRSFTENLATWRKNLFKSSKIRTSEGSQFYSDAKADDTPPPIPPKRRSKNIADQTKNVVSAESDGNRMKFSTTIAYLNDSLWISTENGKIAVMDVVSGAVSAVLSPTCKPDQKQYVREFLVGKTNVISLMAGEGCEFRVVVWDRVGCEDIADIRRYNTVIKEQRDLLEKTNEINQ